MELMGKPPASVLEQAKAAKIRDLERQLRQMAVCQCAYPLIIKRNMCGHPASCPAYAIWKAGT
jgi:hypothetical protein